MREFVFGKLARRKTQHSADGINLIHFKSKPIKGQQEADSVEAALLFPSTIRMILQTTEVFERLRPKKLNRYR